MTKWQGVRSLDLIAAMLSLAGVISAQPKNQPFQPAIPKTWDEKALADWATPVAGLNVRPGHFSEKEYYQAPLDNYRSYPVYSSGQEPAGYWEMLQKVGPKPIIEPPKLRTEADWIEAGRQVFEEWDRVTVRSYDPELIAAIRKVTSVRSPPVPIITPFRWVPTEKGLAVGTSNCGSCHTRYEADGKRINGPPLIVLGGRGNAGPPARPSGRPGADLRATDVVANAPFHMLEPLSTRYYRAYGVPWIKDDVHEALKGMLPEELQSLNALVARWNGSPYYPSKTLDLIGVKDRKYLDATGTHLNRDIGDLMRYAALVSFAESSDFGPHHMLTAGQKKIEARLPDEALYALALYIQSLKPPPNPNASDETAAAGKKIFDREGCGGCHTPGLYTNNKLTLALGFKPAANHPLRSDLMDVSVKTDPNLALKTRKGTGLYKVPTLRGVWYRGLYGHDGSVTRLEEWFDPARLRDDYVPSGFKGMGVSARSVPGHEFGLKLSARDKAALIAFLKTL